MNRALAASVTFSQRNLSERLRSFWDICIARVRRSLGPREPLRKNPLLIQCLVIFRIILLFDIHKLCILRL